MKILVSNKIKVQDYTQEMLDYCKSKLVLPNPEFYKKQAQVAGQATRNASSSSTSA